MTKRRTGSYTYKGFRKDVSDAPQPTGIIFGSRLRREAPAPSRKLFGKWAASDERQNEYAKRFGDELVIMPFMVPPRPKRRSDPK